MRTQRGLGMLLILVSGLVGASRAGNSPYKVALLQVVEIASTGSSMSSHLKDIKGLTADCAQAIRDQLTKEGRFSLADAAAVDKALQASAVDVSKEISPADAAKVGKALGVDVVLLAKESMDYKQLPSMDEVLVDGTATLTLRGIKSADGTELFKNSRIGSPKSFGMMGKGKLSPGAPDLDAKMKIGATEALQAAAGNLHDVLLTPFPIEGKISAINDPKKRLVAVVFEGNQGAADGDDFVILDASGAAVGELELKDVKAGSAEGKFGKKSEAVAVVGALIKSGKL